MNDKQLVRNLQSVGKRCFVSYFALFASTENNSADIVEILKSENSFTEKSCKSRTSHARSIVRAGLGKKALQIVAISRVSEETRAKITELLNSNADT